MAHWIQCDFIQTSPVWADATCGVDTHDGGRKPWHQRIEVSKKAVAERAKSYRSDRQKLHDDILFAMDGPAEQVVLETIRENIQPSEYAQLGAADYVPELKGLMSQTEALRKIARAVLEEHERQDEEDVETLLLS